VLRRPTHGVTRELLSVDERKRPRVCPLHARPRGDDCSDPRLPLVPAVRKLEPFQNDARDRVEQVVLALDVGVQSHPLDPEATAETAHAQRLEALRFDQVEGGEHDLLAAEPWPAAAPGLDIGVVIGHFLTA